MNVSLDTLLARSPYLAELADRHAAWLAERPFERPDQAMAAILGAVGAMDAGRDELALAKALRAAKAKMALLAAAAETGGTWSTAEATAALSDLADAALGASLDFLVREAAARGDLALDAATARSADSGLAVFALGKHGGRELNYSSDIDIVTFFDGRKGVLRDGTEGVRVYGRMVQRLVALMEDRAAGSYVFRTDLRLRPDPGSTPLAISFDAALAYYESRGQNWERAAWIKARPCAGDQRAGEAFLEDLAPYVWRRHLDYATIADIQAMKRQINIARNVGAIRAAGHNVKLGRGGIREIEFFTQTQQLIAGGRDPALRLRPTAAALSALAEAGWITPTAAADLAQAYWFLRAVENRLQMLRDEQTHTLPETPEGIAVVAELMGEADGDAFEARYRATLERVVAYYADLFTEGESLGASEGDLVFTGSDDDPATLDTLGAMGFRQPALASATVRKWHYGGYPATRTAAARAHLTELLPALLKTMAGMPNADEAMARFDDFLSRLPAGVQLFALLRNHEHLRAMLVEFMASAPRLAEAVIHRTHVMDGLIDPAFADEVNRPATLVAKVDSFLGEARSYEDLIDRARIIGQEQMFLISAGLVSGTITAARAGEQFTALAETLLGRIFAAVRTAFVERHGEVPGAHTALLAFGKMASREMTLTSDLDFIILYDAAGAESSNGARPLDPVTYFTRFTQRLVAAVTAPTSQGVLYSADMRLRPSGNAGPLATSLGAFKVYQREQAWTWEHLALTRARVVLADPGIKSEIERVIAAVVAAPRDRGKLVDDVVAMRELMARERKPRHPFDLKLVPGGLVDLEFIAQSGQLVAGKVIDAPEAPTSVVLARMLEAGLLPEGERMVHIHALYSAVLQLMSVALIEPFNDAGWTGAFRELLARRTNYPHFDRLADDIAVMQRGVQAAAEAWYRRARALS